VRWRAPSRDRPKATVEVAGLDAAVLPLLRLPKMTVSDWRSFLRVRVMPERGQRAAEDQPPVLGKYEVVGSVVRFQPRFPLEPGLRFRAEFDRAALEKLVARLSPRSRPGAPVQPKSETLAAEWTQPLEHAQPTARVAEVYPTASTLPENLLRFYIHFSAPMSRGEAYRHIKLVSQVTGKAVDAAFLELGEELWSPDGMRFTLLFSPGRIKRGLKPREELGPILKEGQSYVLAIDRGWPDAAGTPLQSEFRKSFRAGPADETSPDPKTWRIDPPRAHTNGALTVRLPEPLDRALLDRLIAVHDASGRAVAGHKSVADRETLWRFEPEAAWASGDYRLVVGTELEDLAGNSVARPFEVDVTSPITKHVATETVALPFRVAP
jgi:hypothetical protein